MRHKLGAGNAWGAFLLGVSILSPIPASADTIDSVLSSTYLGNPEIKSERAKLRALDEEHPRARSGFRPSARLDADITGTHIESRPDATTDGRSSSRGYTVSVVQPIFRGLRTINSIREADATIYAGREDLRGVEQTVLLKAVTAYVDVIRDRAILRLRRNNVGVLAEQMKATQDRFDVGEVTKTDVAQARARHSGAISSLNLAKANLKSSRAVFEQVVGYNPNSLSRPRSIVKFLPRKLNAGMKRGMEEHPLILAAVYREIAATHAVNRIRGEFMPTVNLEGSFTQRFNSTSRLKQQDTGIIRGTLAMPLYQAGEVSARVRQAKQVVLQRRDELETARKSIRAEVIASWGQVTSIKAQIAADRTQVSANQTALDGVREEEKVGQRTILDVLDAQQELLDSQVDLRTSERNLAVATYRLLAATGRLTIHELGLKVEQYAPEEHYDRVRRKWFGTRVEEYQEEYEHRALVSDRYFPASLK